MTARPLDPADAAALPPCLREPVSRYFSELPAALTRAPERASQALPRVLGGSEFVARACARDPALLQQLIDSGELYRAYDAGELRQKVAEQTAAVHADEDVFKRRLRALRQREFLRLAFRDLAGWASLEEVVTTLSDFADACLDVSLSFALSAATAKHGAPRNEEGGPAAMVVFGLGKLGGRELNFSSDIDLVFAYSAEGETERGLTNHEFFTQVGRTLIALLSDPTAEGMVFRVDMRLRPNGASGPLVLPFDAMETYFQAHGRDWERYAWIKARVCAGDIDAGEDFLKSLKPFLYRKYLDYGMLESLRELKEQINRELQRRGAQDNIKLGAGGIREAEFIGQIFQLVRGGREPLLQQRQIRPVLQALARLGLLAPDAVARLDAAYVFLRRTEHRLQMVRDQQTHSLPSEACERERLAFSMGFADWPAFESVLRTHRQTVHGHFEQVFVPQATAAGEDASLDGVWLRWTGCPSAAQARMAESGQTVDEGEAKQLLSVAGFPDPAAALARLRTLREGSIYAAFSAQGRARLDRLMPLMLRAAGQSGDANTVLTRLLRIVEAIGRRSAYFALLIENPKALEQLVKLVAASDWITDWISQHPVLLDELLHPAVLYTLQTTDELKQELAQRLAGLSDDDLEAQMDALREFRHGHLLRVAAAETGPGLLPEAAREQLCRIAEVVLDAALGLAFRRLVAKHGRPSCASDEGMGFGIVAYGKLGSGELGYASDLDLVFLHRAAGGTTAGPKSIPDELFYARLAQQLLTILTTRTAAGLLYPVDTRLRPSGQSGLLVTNLVAFETYQLERAWVWEHQALVRARPVAGDPAVCAHFRAVREAVLRRPRDELRLREDVRQMREKMRAAQTKPGEGLFDLKQGPGGIVDIEFMVQYWILRWAAEHPALSAHTDNISILNELARAGVLTEARRQRLVEIYRRYLSLEQRLKLMEHRPLVERERLGDDPEKVVAVWQELFA